MLVLGPFWAPNSYTIGTIILIINPNIPFVVLNLLIKFHRDLLLKLKLLSGNQMCLRTTTQTTSYHYTIQKKFLRSYNKNEKGQKQNNQPGNKCFQENENNKGQDKTAGPKAEAGQMSEGN